MKRVLFVCVGDTFPLGAFTFLKSLQDYEPVSVTGLFFSPVEYGPMVSASETQTDTPWLRLRLEEGKMVRDSKALFVTQCQLHNIKHRIHVNEQGWYRDVLARESRFSDIVLLSGELFCSDHIGDQPNSLLQEALHAFECPVMIVPEGYTTPERLVIAYDGSKGSLHAIKQFCYLLPYFTDLPAEFIYVKNESTQEIPDIENLKAFSRLHFGSMNFSKLHFKAANYFTSWIGEQQHALMVSGSFGRSPFSYVTKRSFSEQVIHEHKMPVFIAHC